MIYLHHIKRSICILFVFSIVLSSFSEVWIHLDYYVNFDHIVNNLCINRFAPAKQCDGKCYLKTKLEKNDSEEKRKPQKKTSIKYVYLIPMSPVAPQNSETNKVGKVLFADHHSWKTSDWEFQLLRPPASA